MKKILSVAFTFALAGCAGGTSTTQILTQSTEEAVFPSAQSAPASSSEMNATKPMPKPAAKKTMADKPVMAHKASKPAAKKPAKPLPTKKTAVAGQKYTIQVIALSHNKGFNEYMNKLPSDKPVWSNKKMVDGLPWYTLLYGDFDSKTEAQKALKALPKDIKQFGPFIRSVASIKSSANPEMKPLN
ncbi:SPOR domain-containing protein [Enterovibrio sp. ZSDZ42]|uniref:SPOR domain-containing protein n=1 Tax=Enterovibrio gelatinilyticus TaxID=2899819 RepID=A0ABT5QW15_9GAMM|nr:SPOR domain-containing protein [Enterovibrio sp. ZSDZ42]MDD1792215.1 SPOR domain-containing protein [Enterovibrio sp. ZSDZ42]